MNKDLDIKEKMDEIHNNFNLIENLEFNQLSDERMQTSDRNQIYHSLNATPRLKGYQKTNLL